MNSVLSLTAVALTALLAENFVLVSCLGIGTRTEAFRSPGDALNTGYCLTVVMVLGTLFSWPINRLILEPNDWVHFRLLIFVLLTLALTAGLRWFLQVCIPELSRRTDANLASLTSNCALLGSALLTAQRSYSLGEGLCFALFGGLGTTVALASFASLLGEVDLERCPRCFRGIPIKLVTAGLMAMALVGFYGLHLG